MAEKGLEFKDFYEFLSMELNIGRNDVQSMILTSDKKHVVGELKKSSPKLFDMDVHLLSDVLDSQENILLHRSVDFVSYLPSLIEWRIKNPESNILPFSLKASPMLVGYYKEKISKNISNLLEKLTSHKHNKFSRVFEQIGENDSLVEIEKTFLNIVDNVMNTPQGISTMIKIAGNSHSSNYMLDNGVNSAFIAMSVMKLFADVDSMQKLKVLHMGYAALFQNISLMNGDYSQMDIRNHAQLSAAIATDLMLAPEVIATIAKHHSYEDEQGIKPIFKDRSVKTSEYLQILLSVNLFMDTVSVMNLDCSGMEINKFMWLAARNGYTHISIVKILAELFLSKEDNAYLTTNYMIAEKCPNNPIIWNLKGNVAPTKFLCQKENCKHISNSITMIPQDVNFYHNEKKIAVVGKGNYYSCKMLDELKKKVYKVMAQKK